MPYLSCARGIFRAQRLRILGRPGATITVVVSLLFLAGCAAKIHVVRGLAKREIAIYA